MKKIMAIALALVMMMAIAVPAFAAVSGGSNAGNDTIINTLTVKEDGSDPTFYTVTIPATQTIFWEADSTTIEYVINSQLATGKAVEVKVADADDEYLMKKAGSAYTLAYTLADTEYKASAAVVVDEKDTVTIDTTNTNWAAAAVDEYTDTLTFTAAIV